MTALATTTRVVWRVEWYDETCELTHEDESHDETSARSLARQYRLVDTPGVRLLRVTITETAEEVEA